MAENNLQGESATQTIMRPSLIDQWDDLIEPLALPDIPMITDDHMNFLESDSYYTTYPVEKKDYPTAFSEKKERPRRKRRRVTKPT